MGATVFVFIFVFSRCCRFGLDLLPSPLTMCCVFYVDVGSCYCRSYANSLQVAKLHVVVLGGRLNDEHSVLCCSALLVINEMHIHVVITEVL